MDMNPHSQSDVLHSNWAKFLGCLALCGLMGVSVYYGNYPLTTESHAKKLIVSLTRNKLVILDFPSKTKETRAILIFASGEGGWGSLEESLAKTLQEDGIEVLGLDYPAYSSKDYDLPTLQADFSIISEKANGMFGAKTPPLVLGGYSAGATQAIAACGGPHPPPGTVALFLIDPPGRGRYGMRDTDQLNVLPTGEGSYDARDFARSLPAIRVVQWHAGDDLLDSRDWVDLVTVPHREFDLENEDHYYTGSKTEFLKRILPSIDWALLTDNKASNPQ